MDTNDILYWNHLSLLIIIKVFVKEIYIEAEHTTGVILDNTEEEKDGWNIIFTTFYFLTA